MPTQNISLTSKERETRMKLSKTLGILFAVITLFLFYRGYNQVHFGIHSPNWPTVDGEILKSKVEINSGGTKTIRYLPKIEYSYIVNNKEYFGKDLFFIQSGFGKKWAQEKVKKYPLGKKVKVFYNANNLQTSVLEPGGNLKYIILTIKIVIISCCIFALLSYACYWDYQRVKNAKFDGKMHFLKSK